MLAESRAEMTIEHNGHDRELCFVLVYNNRFDENTEKLEKIYGTRFKNIFHLMPFYDGDKPNVIPVYEDSLMFQGYFAQAYKSIFDDRYSHYIFCADDLLLNTRINEINLLHELKLKENSGYIKNLNALSDMSFEWWHFRRSVSVWFWARRTGILDYYYKQLPDKKAAFELFKSRGLEMKPITLNHLKDAKGGYGYGRSRVLHSSAFMLNHRKDTSLPYPLAASYADFIVVPAWLNDVQ